MPGGWLLPMTHRARLVPWSAAALFGPPAVALALRPTEAVLGSASIALLLVVPVVAIAVSGRRAITTVAAVSAAVAFDYFYTEPRGSLTVSHADEAVIVGSLLVVGLIVAQLSTFADRQREVAGRTASDMAVLRSISDLVAIGEDPNTIAMTGAVLAPGPARPAGLPFALGAHATVAGADRSRRRRSHR